MPEWRKVAEYEELPKDTGNVVDVDGQEVALFRVGDSVCAIDNECPHKEGPLGDGDLDGDVVTCPFHAWEINVRTGLVVDDPTLSSRVWKCKVHDGGVFLEV